MTKLFLHTILIEHCAPKDRKKAIVQYVLTDSEVDNLPALKRRGFPL